MNTISYPYKPKPWVMLLASLFFAACGLTSWHVVTTNHEPMVLLGFPLTAAEAKIVFECTGAASAVFVAIGIPAFFVGLFSSQRLTLTASDISTPKHGFSRRLTVVPLADIQNMTLQTVKRQRLLNIHYRGGKLTIAQSYLPNAAAFEQVRSELTSRVGALRD